MAARVYGLLYLTNTIKPHPMLYTDHTFKIESSKEKPLRDLLKQYEVLSTAERIQVLDEVRYTIKAPHGKMMDIIYDFHKTIKAATA